MVTCCFLLFLVH